MTFNDSLADLHRRVADLKKAFDDHKRHTIPGNFVAGSFPRANTNGNLKSSGVGVTRALVGRSSNQSIPTATLTTLSFTNAYINLGTLWVAAAPTRITIPVDGYYALTLTVQFAANATGTREAIITYTGPSESTVRRCGASAHAAAPTRETSLSVHREDFFSAGTSFQAQVYQTSGAALNVISGNDESIYFAVNLLP